MPSEWLSANQNARMEMCGKCSITFIFEHLLHSNCHSYRLCVDLYLHIFKRHRCSVYHTTCPLLFLFLDIAHRPSAVKVWVQPPVDLTRSDRNKEPMRSPQTHPFYISSEVQCVNPRWKRLISGWATVSAMRTIAPMLYKSGAVKCHTAKGYFLLH